MNKYIFDLVILSTLIFFSSSIELNKAKARLLAKTRDTNCSKENGTCNLPEGQVCSIAYGEGDRWSHRHGQVGNVECNNKIFGDPFIGTIKRCYYYNCESAVHCSREGGICNLPANSQCQVTYGINSGYSVRTAKTSIGCNNGVFGDPWVGILKNCFYYGCSSFGTECAREGGNCVVPEGKVCTVVYGMGDRWTQRASARNSIGCNNGIFGDPFVGTLKACLYKDCEDFSNGCAIEGEICTVPQNQECTVQYGFKGKKNQISNVMGDIPCNNNVFGDPSVGDIKNCRYIDCKSGYQFCSKENGQCQLPQGQKCSVRYGMGPKWTYKSSLQGTVGCNNGFFGDPNVGILKTCYFYDCVQEIVDFSLSGTMFDATTDQPIPAQFTSSAQVTYTELFGSQRTISAKVTGASWEIQLPKGKYRRTVSINGFAEDSSDEEVAGPRENTKVLLSPNVDGWRAVLTWGQAPKDLDLHVATNTGTNVSYNNKKLEFDDFDPIHNRKLHTVVTLDVDNREGFGPETITMKQIRGKYRLYVHRYSNDGELSSSGARVVLFRGEHQVHDVRVPEGSGNKALWIVYDIDADNNSFRVVNQFQSTR